MNSSMTRIGYARTSTADQNLAAQIAALKAAGCEVIREEQKSGTSLDGRSQLNTILDFIHPGETLVVTWIDRLVLLAIKFRESRVNDFRETGNFSGVRLRAGGAVLD